MLRKYKTVAERVRPEDRMIGHTGFLIFGRK
jgi:tRNA (adenine57-N1/adenine58-N1)-methyltransferase